MGKVRDKYAGIDKSAQNNKKSKLKAARQEKNAFLQSKAPKRKSKSKAKDAVPKTLTGKILSHKTKTPAINLLSQPARVYDREFKGLSLYQEVEELNVLGVDETTGEAFTEDWTQQSNKVKL